jgi:hypothetical protein
MNTLIPLSFHDGRAWLDDSLRNKRLGGKSHALQKLAALEKQAQLRHRELEPGSASPPPASTDRRTALAPVASGICTAPCRPRATPSPGSCPGSRTESSRPTTGPRASRLPPGRRVRRTPCADQPARRRPRLEGSSCCRSPERPKQLRRLGHAQSLQAHPPRGDQHEPSQILLPLHRLGSH